MRHKLTQKITKEEAASASESVVLMIVAAEGAKEMLLPTTPRHPLLHGDAHGERVEAGMTGRVGGRSPRTATGPLLYI